MISYLWAESKGHIIGSNGTLPWNLPSDMHYFKATTTGNVILAGKRTYESFGRPLPNRLNVVLTHTSKDDFPKNVKVFNNVNEFLSFSKDNQDKEIFVVGGAQIFKLLLPYVDFLYRTVIDYKFSGDTVMPDINYNDFKLIKSVDGKMDDKNIYPHTFEVFKRK
ncbi:dihydrofolate reductase [Apilactobacillus apisilvae]|uniref:Dihydrofolate reductase n=1 Tax=Apilactobacillus apisilvae TaxID=2923364 RepID=A0ABY4PIU3_9LACO|nr:dihydrofolate reductase [Apilactobacillus apisilvae]UQS85410.1 dihydrofolate reductase [Apilactobacillus apisilvae]